MVVEGVGARGFGSPRRVLLLATLVVFFALVCPRSEVSVPIGLVHRIWLSLQHTRMDAQAAGRRLTRAASNLRKHHRVDSEFWGSFEVRALLVYQ